MGDVKKNIVGFGSAIKSSFSEKSLGSVKGFFSSKSIFQQGDDDKLDKYYSLINVKGVPTQEAMAKAFGDSNQRLRGLVEQFPKATSATELMTAAQQKSSIVLRGLSTVARIATVALNMVANMAIMYGITKLVGLINDLIHAEEKALEAAKESADALKSVSDSLNDQITSISDLTDKYKELRKELNDSTKSESSLAEVRSQLYDIQSDMIDQYPNHLKGLDLVNGKYEEQLALLEGINKESKQQYLTEHKNEYDEANTLLNQDQGYVEYGKKTSLTKDEANKDIKYIKEINGLLEETGAKIDYVTYKGFDGKDYSYGFKLTTKDVATNEEAYDIALAMADKIRNSAELVDNPIAAMILSWLSDFTTDDVTAESINNAKSSTDFYEKIAAEMSPQSDLYKKMVDTKDKFANQLAETPVTEYMDSEDLIAAKTEFSALWDEWVSVSGGASKEVKAAFEDVYNAVYNDSGKFFTMVSEKYTEGFSGAAEMIKKSGLTGKDVVNGYFGGSGQADAIKDSYDWLVNLAKGYEISEEALVQFLVQFGILKGELEDTPEVKDVTPTINLSLIQELNAKLGDLESSYSSVINAVKEYNKNGFVSMSTIDSLISMDDEYINCLVDENGQLVFNANAFKELARIKIEEAKVSVYQAATTELNRIASLGASEAYTEYALSMGNATDEAYKVAKASYEAAIASGFYNKQLADDVWDAANKRAALLDEQLKSLTKGTYDVGKATEDTSKKTETYVKILEAELELLDLKMDNALLGFNDYASQRKAVIQKYYDEGKIKADDYYKYLQECEEKSLGYMDRAISAVINRLDKEIKGIQNTIDTIEKENDALNKQKDIYDSVLSAINETFDQKKEAYELEKQNIQDQIDALQEENEERKKQIDLEKAKYALEQAQRNRIDYTYDEETGRFVYTTDSTAIKDAQENLDDLVYQGKIQALEKQKDTIDKDIDALEKLQKKWSDVSSAYEKFQNDMKAKELLGEHYQEIVLEARAEDIADFEKKYTEIESKLHDNQELINSYNEKVEYYTKLKEEWSNVSKAYEEETDAQIAAMFWGQDWEKDVLSGNIKTLQDFKNDYAAEQQAIVDISIKAANARIEAARQAAAAENGNITGPVNISGGGSSNDDNNGNSTEDGVKKYRVRNNKDGLVYASDFASPEDAKKWINEQQELSNPGDKAQLVIEDYMAAVQFKVVNSDTGKIHKKDFATEEEALKWIESQEGRYPSNILNKMRVEKYHSGVLGNYPDSNNEKQLEAFRKIAINKLKPEEFLAILKSNELVFNRDQLDNVASNIGGLVGSMYGKNNDSNMYDQNTKTTNESFQFSIGEIHLHEVQDVNTLGESIIKYLPNIFYQRSHMRK